MRKMVTTSLSFLLLWNIIHQGAFASIEQQRAQYQRIMMQLADKKQSILVNREAINKLKAYPLYPYAENSYLLHQVSSLSYTQTQQFLSRYATVPVTKKLRSAFYRELVKRNDWKALAELSNKDNATSGQCYYYYSQYQLGNQSAAFEGTKVLWLTPKSLPSECDLLLNVWKKNNQLTSDLIMLRMELALSEKNVRLVKALVNMLPNDSDLSKVQLLALLNDPTKLTDFAKNTKPSGLTHHIIHVVFPQFARKNVVKAQADLPLITRYQKILKADQIELTKSIAANLFNDNITEQQKRWRDKFIAENPDGDLIERELRIALAKSDYLQISYWINLLPATDKAKEEWQYWQGVSLIATGKKAQGEQVLKQLVPQRSYYALLSAQRLGMHYPIEQIRDQVNIDKTFTDAIKKNERIARIRELLNIGQLSSALQEWLALLSTTQNNAQIAQLARYAREHQWALLSVHATIYGKLWNQIDERFPLTYTNLFKNEVKDKNINHSYAIAIARQESALHPEAVSPVGARGLMQLMPATAKEVAQKVGLSTYGNVRQLFEPAVNISLGTSYLEQMYKKFDNNRVLTSAAYNAGPGRVTRWLEKSNGSLNVDIFIESIPIKETRNYVKSVLMYDYFYRYLMGESPKTLLTQAELDKLY